MSRHQPFKQSLVDRQEGEHLVDHRIEVRVERQALEREKFRGVGA